MATPGEPGRQGSRQGEAEPHLQGAFSPDGVDLTLIRWFLQLSPAERLQAAQDMVDSVSALREAGEPPLP